MLSLLLNNLKTCLLLFITVSVVHPHKSDAQSYYFNIEQNQPQFFNFNDFRAINLIEKKTTSTSNYTDQPATEIIAEEELDNKTKLIIFKKTFNDKSEEYSEKAMDVITVIWYLAMFLALAAFFMLMACSERRRSAQEERRRAQNNENNEVAIPPPTPSPSYSEFAPPSYDTVIKMQHNAKTSVFVIPFNGIEAGQTDNSKDNTNTTTAAAPVKFYTVNELPIMGS